MQLFRQVKISFKPDACDSAETNQLLVSKGYTILFPEGELMIDCRKNREFERQERSYGKNKV